MLQNYEMFSAYEQKFGCHFEESQRSDGQLARAIWKTGTTCCFGSFQRDEAWQTGRQQHACGDNIMSRMHTRLWFNGCAKCLWCICVENLEYQHYSMFLGQLTLFSSFFNCEIVLLLHHSSYLFILSNSIAIGCNTQLQFFFFFLWGSRVTIQHASIYRARPYVKPKT